MKLILYLIIGFHFTIIISNTIFFFILPFTQPLEVAIPICTLLAWMRFGICPLVVLENLVRDRLKMPRITSFIRHYMWRR